MRNILTALFCFLTLTILAKAQVVDRTTPTSYNDVVNALGYTPLNPTNPILPTCLAGFAVASSSPAVLPIVCRILTISDIPSPMTTAGDLIYGGVGGAWERLPAGTSSQVLIGGTAPTWGSVNIATMVSGLGTGVANAAGIATNANGGFSTVSVSTTAPTSPSLFQSWLNTTATPYVWNIWDGASWVSLGTINATTHAFTSPTLNLSASPSGGFGGVSGNLPIANMPQIGASTFLCNSTAGTTTPTACSAGTNVIGTLGVAADAASGFRRYAGANLQTDINNASSGLRVPLAAGGYPLSTALNIAGGAYLDGQCSASPAGFTCATIYPTANLAALVTSASLATITTNFALDNLVIDGCATTDILCAATHTVTSLIQLSPEAARVSNNYISNSSGTCLYLQQPTGGANNAWINVISGNTIISCAGDGFYSEVSDSIVSNNYFGNGNINVHYNQTGSRFVGNQVDVAVSEGMRISNLLSAGFPGTAVTIVGNEFTGNPTPMRFMVGAGTTHTVEGPIVGNHFGGPQGAVVVENNVSDGLMVGDAFGSGMTKNVSWGGTGNTGWQLIGVSSTLAPASRFTNLPADAQVISGGAGGAWNRLQSLILDSVLSGVTVADATLNVYGNSTVLGQANVNARFGMYRNTAGFDAALLTGSVGGISPFLGCFAGELTNLGGCGFFYKGTSAGSIISIWHINSAGYFAFDYDPLLPKITASGTAPGAGEMKLEVVAGTNAGTCKLQAYAGTSATPVTIVDNVGAGC